MARRDEVSVSPDTSGDQAAEAHSTATTSHAGLSLGSAAESASSGVADAEERSSLTYGRADTWYKTFARWMSYLGAVALGVITAVCFVDVVGSKFFGKAVPSQFELVANLNLVMVFLAVFYVQMDRGSVAIELLQDRFPRLLKLLVRLFGSLLGAAVCFFSAYRGWFYLVDFWVSHKSASGVWHFPIWPFQAVLVLGFFCLGVAFVFTMGREIADFRARRGRFAFEAAKERGKREG